MIVLPKEDSNRQISLEKQLEKLNNMKSVLASSHSTINLDYAMNQIINQIKIIEDKIKEKDFMSSIKDNNEVFDTEKYAEKAKSGI